MRVWYGVFALSIAVLGLSLAVFFINNYFYPVVYKNEIYEVAKQYDVSPALIASVINVESGYNPEAKSNKGAAGLMQLMPSTAEWICQIKGVAYDEQKLVEPQFNIKVGTLYLQYLLSQFGSVENALLAYNAGYGNVKNWLQDKNLSEDGQTLKVIPFEETRNYIVKINKNLYHYNKKYK